MLTELVAKASSESFVGLSGVIFGSLLTTFGVWLTNNANAKRQMQQLAHEERLSSQKIKKERLEELYILVCHWGNLFFSQYMNLNLVMDGHIDYNEYLDRTSTKDLGGFDFSRIEMIIDIYGAQLGPAYEKVMEAREAINEVNAAHKSAYKQGRAGDVFKRPAADAQMAFGEACDELKRVISEAARAA
ncbi:hypothetical protein [Pseudomonas sp. FP2300]|uniref:hypothetical protein n=1 Tax=Pseudomonas sp. FP2300 TaxID=2954090 RepID=UPI0027354093|nr:hypothetical protein [Pseudomonas sp. FP2300]WLH64826.1 hypothetical protein PSH86_09740 [Pseudomonas sp. FP2300]